MFATTAAHHEGGHKDSMRNALASGEFVVNLATYALREAVNLTSTPAPRGVDELDLAGLTAVPSRLVAPPRVDESPVQLECRVVTSVELPTTAAADPNTVVFGEVVGVHIADEVIVDGLVDVRLLRPIGRLGYREYVDVTNSFEMTQAGLADRRREGVWLKPDRVLRPHVASMATSWLRSRSGRLQGSALPRRGSSGGNPLGGFPLANNEQCRGRDSNPHVPRDGRF